MTTDDATRDRWQAAVDAAAIVYEEVGPSRGWLSSAGVAVNVALRARGFDRMTQKERKTVCRTVEAIWRTHELPTGGAE